MNQSYSDMPQVLTWESQNGFSFQYFSDGRICIEEDHYVRPQQTASLPGQVIFPVSTLDTLEQFIAQIKAIQNGGVVSAPPSIRIAS